MKIPGITRIPHSTQTYYVASMQVRHLKRLVEMGSLLLAGLLMLRLALLLRHQLQFKLFTARHLRSWPPRPEFLFRTHPWKGWSVHIRGPVNGHSPSSRAKVVEILWHTIQLGRT